MGNPWYVLGDFNVSLNLVDSSACSSSINMAMTEFKECIEDLCIDDINQIGLHFTWNQRPNAEIGILKKLDRVMGNDLFISKFTNAYTEFCPYRISDHSPAVLKIPVAMRIKPKTVKFANFVSTKPEYALVVKKGWQDIVEGHKMFQVTKKLKLLKKPLRQLMWNKGNLHDRVVKLRKELDNIQNSLDKDATNINLRKYETEALQAYHEALRDEENFMKQTAKVSRLSEGDKNTKYFYRIINGKQHESCKNSVMNDASHVFDARDAPGAFVDHYKSF